MVNVECSMDPNPRHSTFNIQHSTFNINQMTHTSILKSPPPTRTSGVLLHPTSLPGRFGIGDLGDELLAFLDWAQSAGLHIWQVLPLNPPGYGYSPYGCISSP